MNLENLNKCGKRIDEYVEMLKKPPYGVDMPEGFCPPAWRAIQSFAAIYASGGKVYGFDTHVVACPDGVRPVLLRLESAQD